MMRIEEDFFMEIVDFIPVKLSVKELLQLPMARRLREKDIAPLVEECRLLIEPKAVYAFLKVTNIEKDKIQLDSGHTLKSIILSDVLEYGQTIVPYVVTIGPRLEEQGSKNAKDSILQAWVMERIGDFALGKASAYVRSLVEETLGSAVSGFGPGTGTGKLFSIEQQEILFQILDPPKSIGVHLTPSYLMVPRKSVSGVFAVTHLQYVACQYCPKERCENRRKPFGGEYLAIKCERKDSL